MHKLRSDILSAGKERPSPVAAKIRAPKGEAGIGPSLAAIPVKRTESRTTNQREKERAPAALAATVLTLRRRSFEATIVNLSSDGAMIEVDCDAHIGERVSIPLGDGSDGECVVRWVKGSRLGIEFDGYSLEIGRADDGSFVFRRNNAAKRRISERAPRQTLVWRATVHTGADAIAVRLANVSATGAMLEGELKLSPGTSILLDLAGAGMMPSTVRWAEPGRIGVLFDRDFDVKLLSICSQAEAGPRKVEWIKPEFLQDENDPNSPHRDWSRFAADDLASFR